MLSPAGPGLELSSFAGWGFDVDAICVLLGGWGGARDRLFFGIPRGRQVVEVEDVGSWPEKTPFPRQAEGKDLTTICGQGGVFLCCFFASGSFRVR